MNLRRHLLILSCLLISQSSLAEKFGLSFGPYVGSGSADGSSEVRYVSGFRAIASLYEWQLGSVGISPQLAFENSFFNARRRDDLGNEILDYDHRMVTAGLLAEMPTGGELFNKVFTRGLIGQSFSKLAVDRTTDSSFSQAQLEGIRGTASQLEIGAVMSLQPDFEILVSALTTWNRLNQSQLRGSQEIESDPQLNLPLTRRSLDASTDELPDHSRHVTYGTSLTIRLLF